MDLRRILLGAALLLGAAILVRAAVADETRDLVQDLKRVLRGEDVEDQVAVLSRVERACAGWDATHRRVAAAQIGKALEAETDGSAREAMLRALARLGGTTGWVPVLLAAADTRRDGHVLARQLLLWGGGDYLEVIQRLLDQDTDPTYRADLLLLLRDRRRPDAVPLLLDTLERDTAWRAKSAAVEALEAITGQALGYDAGAWRAWWEAEGEAALRTQTPTPVEETVTTDAAPWPDVHEPEPHVTRSLVPTFYDLPLTAKDIVFVLDISGSVGAGGVTRLKRELIDAVERLGSDVHVAAIFFDEEVRLWRPEMAPATPANKAALALFLRAIQPGKRTDVFTPLHAGLQIVKRRVEALEAAGTPIREAVTMIVVSDGVETQAGTPPHIVEDKLSRLDPRNTVVHAVALGSKGSRLLHELARRGGGHYVQAP